MSKKFDPERPHITVHGMSSVKFKQDGQYFNISGDPVDVTKQDDLNPGADTPVPLVQEVPQIPVEPEPPVQTKPDYEAMKWTELRDRVVSLGGTYKNKTEAVKFLETKDAENAAASEEKSEEPAVEGTTTAIAVPDFPPDES